MKKQFRLWHGLCLNGVSLERTSKTAKVPWSTRLSIQYTRNDKKDGHDKNEADYLLLVLQISLNRSFSDMKRKQYRHCGKAKNENHVPSSVRTRSLCWQEQKGDRPHKESNNHCMGNRYGFLERLG